VERRNPREVQEFLLAQFLRDVFEPARLAHERSGGHPVDRTIAYGAFLEAAALLSIGMEARLFPIELGNEVLAYTADVLEAPIDLPEELVARVARHPQLDFFAKGDWTDAASYRSIPPPASEDAEDAAVAFQSSLLAMRALRSDPRLSRLGPRMMLLGDAEWDVAWQRAVKRIRALLTPSPLDPTGDDALDEMDPIDGTIRAVTFLSSLDPWTRSLAGLSPAEEDWDLDVLPPPERARLGVVQAVGRVLRWRLDLTDVRVAARFRKAVERIDHSVDLLGERIDREIGGPDGFVSPWPNGFAHQAHEAEASWHRLSDWSRSYISTG
jgi:hypothetical protein